MKLLVPQDQSVHLQRQLERQMLAAEHHASRHAMPELIKLAPLALLQLVPVDLEVEEVVVALLIGLIRRNAMITIKASQAIILLSHSQTAMKPVSTFYKLTSLTEKKLPMTC